MAGLISYSVTIMETAHTGVFVSVHSAMTLHLLETWQSQSRLPR